MCSLCASPTVARGWCRKHYLRWYKHGDPTVRKPKPGRAQRREANGNWKGEDATYTAAHAHIRIVRGRAAEHTCVDCPDQAAEWSFKHPTGYSRDPADYAPRCVPCHKRKDRNGTES